VDIPRSRPFLSFPFSLPLQLPQRGRFESVHVNLDFPVFVLGKVGTHVLKGEREGECRCAFDLS
jgi:hypothetical protein